MLMALLIPAVQKVRAAADRARCRNNVHQLVTACHNYYSEHKSWPKMGNTANELSWHVYILPYIEQKPLYDKFDLRPQGHYTDANRLVNALNPIPVFLCPSTTADKMQQGPNDNVNTPDLVSGQPTYTAHYLGVSGPKSTNGYTGTVAYGVEQPPARRVRRHGSLEGVFQARRPDIRADERHPRRHVEHPRDRRNVVVQPDHRHPLSPLGPRHRARPDPCARTVQREERRRRDQHAGLVDLQRHGLRPASIDGGAPTSPWPTARSSSSPRTSP